MAEINFTIRDIHTCNGRCLILHTYVQIHTYVHKCNCHLLFIACCAFRDKHHLPPLVLEDYLHVHKYVHVCVHVIRDRYRDLYVGMGVVEMF